MWAWRSGRLFAIGAGVAVLVVGCVVQDGPASVGSGSSSGGGGGAGSSSGGSGGGSTLPMLVDVDPNRTLTAHPGDGVGVFSEYRTGGHWHVWWTCDTNKTALSCGFDVAATVQTGTIANAASDQFETGDQLVQPSTQEIEAITQTSTGVDAVTFDASPGAIITVDAKMNGQDSGGFMFFVQDGQVNGGYQGALTDPLMLEPSSP